MEKPVKWRAKVENIVGCNCNWGCPCAFDAPPTVGHCEGVIGHHIVSGRYGTVTLDGLKWVLVVRWPGAIHERGGRGIVFLDARAAGAKRAALEAIATGKAGGPIGVFMSTVDAGLEVREATIDFKLEGEHSRVRIAGLVDLALEPILNPVTKLPHYAAAVFKTGLLTSREDYFANRVCSVQAGELSMSHPGKNAHVYVTAWKGP
jgi:hypothetical protein